MTAFDPSTPGILAQSPAATVTLLAPVARFSLRARGDVSGLGAALGLTLPQTIGEVASSGARQVVCLGPDEWTLQTEVADAKAVIDACAGVYDSLPHSLVEVSSREVTLHLAGPQVKTLLTLGLPRDPDTIAPGTARRTVFDGVTVVLWHDADGGVRMDIWASFVPHVLHLLQTGVAELAAELA